MSMQLQLSSTVTGWEMWVFLRINHFHNQERIFSIGTTFCQFSLCNMVKHERNVRSLITPIYLPAKLLLLRPSGNVQDFLRYVRLPQDSLLSSISFFAIKNKTHWSKTPGQKKKKEVELCRYGRKMRASLTFKLGIAVQGWFTNHKFRLKVFLVCASIEKAHWSVQGGGSLAAQSCCAYA